MVDDLGAHARAVPCRPDLHVEWVSAIVVPNAFVVARHNPKGGHLADRGVRETVAGDLAVLRSSGGMMAARALPTCTRRAETSREREC